MEQTDLIDTRFFNAFADLLEDFPDLKAKYGLSLIHSHFDINSDEVLHETNDPQKRMLVRRVLKIEDLPKGSFPTEWIVHKDKNQLSARPTSWCCD